MLLAHLDAASNTFVVASTVDTPASSQLNTAAVAALISLFIPLLINLITKSSASEGLKSVLNVVAAGLAAVIALFTTPGDQAITWYMVANTFIAALVTSVAAYKGIWKPTGVSGSVAAATSGVGFGPRPVLETADKGAEEAPAVILDNAGDAEAPALFDPEVDPALARGENL